MAKKKGLGKWIIIIIILLVLALASMLIAGIIGLIGGVSNIETTEFQPTNSNGNVALIDIKGMILTETSNDFFNNNQDTSSEQIVERLNNIKQDDNIKAVIFEINSPGGSGVAADEISRAIRDLNKTTIAYIRDMGTSAAYWVASAADKIYANRISFVGSIGARAGFLEFSGLMEDYNVTYQRFVAGENKDFGSPYRKPTEQEKEMFQEQLNQVHEVFIEEVAINRKTTTKNIRNHSHGMFYTGIRAKEFKLIDGFGGKKEAIAYVENQENITADIVEYKRKKSFFDIFSMAQEDFSYNIGKGIGNSIVEKQGKPNLMLR